MMMFFAWGEPDLLRHQQKLRGHLWRIPMQEP